MIKLFVFVQNSENKGHKFFSSHTVATDLFFTELVISQKIFEIIMYYKKYLIVYI